MQPLVVWSSAAPIHFVEAERRQCPELRLYVHWLHSGGTHVASQSATDFDAFSGPLGSAFQCGTTVNAESEEKENARARAITSNIRIFSRHVMEV
jgi:hypothetical protein